jgi:hypothetical protein
LWSIPLPLIAQLVGYQIDRDGGFYATWIESESGFIENGTALLLLPAGLFALYTARTLWIRHGPRAGLWFVGVGILCLSFLGEEISWGQHWFGWEPTAYFAEHNRQGEMNVHNLNIHLGRVVKTILTLAIVVGGMLVPLWQRSAPPNHSLKRWLFPTMVCVPAASFVFGVRLVERLKTWFDLDWEILAVNLKESQELYIAIFLLIYTWSVYARVRHLRADAAI